jgi:predicted phosphodiesterase
MEFCLENGEEKTRETFSISQSTLEKYRRTYKEQISNDIDKKIYLGKIFERFSEHELKAIAEGTRIIPGQESVPRIDFEGQRIRIGFLTDTHIGSIFFKPELLEQAIEEFKKEGCEIVCHAGDVTDGMSRREGHVYELSHIGYDRQKDYAIELLSQWEGKMYCISGNHDLWFLKNANIGANIVKDICEKLPDAEFLGYDEGDISLNGKATLRLWHGGDGNSYATSYRIQKIIESFTGGEKPNVLLAGHTHKQLYMFERHIHAVSGGSICLQTSWMRMKRIQAHPGFWILDIWINDTGVSKFQSCWFPFYQ